jgi:signal transduction histidine kinase
VICPAERGRCPITDLKMSMDRSERVLITADGERCSILKSVSPFWIQGHQYLLESFVDITDRVKAEHAINQANKKLNILSSVTRHDILNQLTVLRGYLTLTEDAAEDAGISETTGPYLQQIEKVARTIRLQIEFTKDYQDIGIQAPGWHRIGLILDYVTSRLDSGGVAVENAVGGLEIYADPLITEVFYNLLDNALRHAGLLTRITVSCREVPEGLIISVSDDGDGIAQVNKEKIFERGFGKNTGYGLFIIRDILDITGITIHETGTFGEGAQFDLLIPERAFRFIDHKDGIPVTQSDQRDIPGTPN